MKKSLLLNNYFSVLAILAILFTTSCQKKEGCTDGTAKNYNAEALIDDGSCKYPTKGCTDPLAANYNPLAEEDDGTCKKAEEDDDDDNNGNGGNGNGGNNGNGPANKQGVLVIKWTGTNCGPCGGSAHDAIEQYAAISSDVHVLAGHSGSGDPMNNWSAYGWLKTERPTGGGIPKIYVCDSLVTYSSFNDQYISDYLNQAPVANCKLSLDAATGDVTGNVKFFQNGTSNNYHLSIFIVEDNIGGGTSNASHPDYEQLGTSDPNYEHDHVVRASVSGAGVSLGSSPSAGDETTISETLTIDPSWDTNNLHVVGVIWEEDATSGEYIFINVD
ncbi:MAG: Omp28-related outer membrane protein [Flavobacteriales bacterium]|nr:Omp28-related outer membrane protein [Flavobacteriales bacterium]